jgi:ATP-dependent helicase IRC3
MRHPEIKNAVVAATATFSIADTLKRNTTSHLTMPDPGILKKAQETETTTNIQLRPYQEECIQSIIDHHRQGVNKQLVSMATGAGKTVVFCRLIEQMQRKTLVIAHTTELIDQAKDKLEMICPKLDVGIVRAGSKEYDRPVVVATIQSASQPDTLAELQKQGFTLCIYDEAHRAVSNSASTVLTNLDFLDSPEKLLLGFTATAFRNDSKGLGEVFDKIVYTKSIKDLIGLGYLCNPKGIKIKTDLDLSTVKTEDGDFVTQSLASVMDTPQMNEIVVNSFIEQASGRKAVCFSVTVCHAQHLAEAFSNRGIASEAIYGDMPAHERYDLLERFKSGNISVLTNCQLLTEGWDCPEVDCILVAKPTQSKGLYTQMVGRGLRPCGWINKKDCLILDFGSKSHSLCSVAALTNDAESEEAEQQEKAEGKMSEFAKGLPPSINKKLRAAIIEFDLLGDTFQWQNDGATGFTLPGGGKKYLKIFKTAAEDKYDVVFFNGNESKTISKGLNFEYSFATAEDFANNNRSHFIVSDMNASWRNDPISENQKKCFRSCGYKNGIEDMTKGQASIIIASGILKRKSPGR